MACENCRDYCPYSSLCKRTFPDVRGAAGFKPEDCVLFYKIDDLLMDAREADVEEGDMD